MRLEQVQRFILAKKIFWGYGLFKTVRTRPVTGLFARIVQGEKDGILWKYLR